MKSIVVMCCVLLLPGIALASGGKQRLGDDTIDEVRQLCQQAGWEDAVIEVEVCTGPEDGNCIVTRIDCSLDEDD